MRDILYDAALKYETMIGKGYHIVVGRKCKEYPVQLRFTQDAFFHLVGLQHLTDITFSSTNKERVYKEILLGNITTEMIKKSIFYDDFFIEERIVNLFRLEEMIDSCQFLFLINHHEYIKYTKIYADYLCEYLLPENREDCLYFFSVKNTRPKIENECGGCSFFKRHTIDFRRGTSETKLLLNEKINNVGQKEEFVTEIYRHPKYEVS